MLHHRLRAVEKIVEVAFEIIGGRGGDGAGTDDHDGGVGGVGGDLRFKLFAKRSSNLTLYVGDNGASGSSSNTNVGGTGFTDGGDGGDGLFSARTGVYHADGGSGGGSSALKIDNQLYAVAAGGGGGGAAGLNVDGESGLLYQSSEVSSLGDNGAPGADAPLFRSVRRGSGGGGGGGGYDPGSLNGGGAGGDNGSNTISSGGGYQGHSWLAGSVDSSNLTNLNPQSGGGVTIWVNGQIHTTLTTPGTYNITL